MSFYIPTLEEIYNEYHKQTFFFMNGVYPRKIKNYSKILNDPQKKEYLLRFQNMIKRNLESLDWKIYIYACASILKNKFDLKILGSLAGTKLYRNYIQYTYNESEDIQKIHDEIIRSLQFLNLYLKENNFTFNSYFLENINFTPLALKHIYAGTISLYFYAALPYNLLYKIFNQYTDDIFQELFHLSKNEFLEKFIFKKKDTIIRFPIIRAICDKFEEKFKNQ